MLSASCLPIIVITYLSVLTGSIAVRITDEGIKAEGVQVAHTTCGGVSAQTQVVVMLLEPVVLEKLVT